MQLTARLPDVLDLRQTRAAYEDNVRAVIGRLVASGAHVIISGPTLIGERPRRKNKKDAQLDAYWRINRRIASILNVEYIDTKRPFFARRPVGTPSEVDRGLLTEDGEHLNDRGVDVAQLLFVHAIDAWLRTPLDCGSR